LEILEIFLVGVGERIRIFENVPVKQDKRKKEKHRTEKRKKKEKKKKRKKEKKKKGKKEKCERELGRGCAKSWRTAARAFPRRGRTRRCASSWASWRRRRRGRETAKRARKRARVRVSRRTRLASFNFLKETLFSFCYSRPMMWSLGLLLVSGPPTEKKGAATS
jgi:hypothetical protein